MALAISFNVFLAALIAIVIKPFRKKEAFYAVIFCSIVFLFKLVSFNDAIFVIKNIWNAVFSLISIMIISSILYEIGFFKWAALTIAFSAEGSGKRLFVYTILLGSIISIFFNNDGTIIILTPIIYEMVSELGFKKVSILPFLFACGFIADAASIPLVVSNLTNIVNADALGISFIKYFEKMLLPGISAIIFISITMFLYFRESILPKYDTSKINNPDDYVKDWNIFNAGIIILLIVVVGYFVASRFKIPVSFVSISGAVFLTLYARKRNAISIRYVVRNAPFDVILFAFGMYMIVFALYKNGFNHMITKLDVYSTHLNPLSASLFLGIKSTITACLMNNLPSVMIGALSIKDGSLIGVHREIAAYANIIGNDIGAKITPIGSLATILWIKIARDRGINISWREYIRTSICVVTPVVIALLVMLGLMIK